MYEEYFDKYDAENKGKAVISVIDDASVNMAYPNYGRGVSVKKDTRIGYMTGYWKTDEYANWIQIEFENPFYLDGVSYSFGFIDATQYRLYTYGTTGYNATSLIGALIENNKTIYENNLLCAGVMKIYEDKGVSVPVAHKQKLYDLHNRLAARNAKMAESSFLENKQTATPTAFVQYSDDLNSFIANPGIGIAPVVVAIIVYVVVPVLLTAVIYLIFKNTEKESENDVVYSKELTATLLQKLTPEEYKQLLAENKENATKIANAASGQSLLNTVKYVAIGLVGFFAIDKFLQSRK